MIVHDVSDGLVCVRLDRLALEENEGLPFLLVTQLGLDSFECRHKSLVGIEPLHVWHGVVIGLDCD